MKTGPQTLAVLALAAFAALPPAVRAEDGRRLSGRWALCGAPLVPPASGDPARREAPDTEAIIRSDYARYDGETGRYTFIGDAELARADQRLTADRLRYQPQTGRVAARGDIRYLESGVLLESETARFDLDDYHGRFSPVDYRIAAGHLHGHAETATVESREVTHYEDVRLTTCNPGDVNWWLHAGSLTIDRGTNQGHAWNAWVTFQHVPLFYTPYIRFPIGDERQSGFLAPSLGRSEEGGAMVSLPWYWNIAPNMDATFTPTYYARRGPMLGSEYRYLTPWLAGDVRGAWLPHDDAYGEARWSIDQAHYLRYGEHLSGELIQQRVSDPDYLDDFSNDFTERSEHHLESHLRLAYARRDWTVSAGAQSWQTIDESIGRSNLPYARQPRVNFRYDPPLSDSLLRFSLEAETVRFEHPAPELVATGSRLDLVPRLSAPLRRPGYFVVPSVAWRYTSYRLQRPDPAAPEAPSRSLPIYSLDTGLVFERDLRWFDRHLQQTLEPRLFYLYIPYRDQSELPRFDTAEGVLTLGQLFRENRFTGPDRIGDANQITAGLTSRFLDYETGVEYLRLSAGQTFYFDEREVTLDGTPDTADRSFYVTELRANLPFGVNASVDYAWDPQESGNNRVRARLQWRGAADQVVNLFYTGEQRGDVRELEEAGLSLALPVGLNWQVAAGWRYSLPDNETRERFAGLGYESCCYAVRAVYREYATDDGLDQQILLQLELKGLGGVGDRILDFLEEAVPGYAPPRY